MFSIREEIHTRPTLRQEVLKYCTVWSMPSPVHNVAPKMVLTLNFTQYAVLIAHAFSTYVTCMKSYTMSKFHCHVCNIQYLLHNNGMICLALSVGLRSREDGGVCLPGETKPFT